MRLSFSCRLALGLLGSGFGIVSLTLELLLQVEVFDVIFEALLTRFVLPNLLLLLTHVVPFCTNDARNIRE